MVFFHQRRRFASITSVFKSERGNEAFFHSLLNTATETKIVSSVLKVVSKFFRFHSAETEGKQSEGERRGRGRKLGREGRGTGEGGCEERGKC